MAIRLATLSNNEALEKAGTQNCGYLPKMIGISGKVLVLSDNRIQLKPSRNNDLKDP
jgi:hypothetical protein